MFIYINERIYHDIDGLVQDCINPIANAWSYCSLALSHRYIPANNVIFMDRIAFNLYKMVVKIRILRFCRKHNSSDSFGYTVTEQKLRLSHQSPVTGIICSL